MLTEEKKMLFKKCIGNISITSANKSIGTYQEKTLHKVVKNYFENNEENQEIKIGKYVCDILKENKIIEIQTRSFNKLVGKLDYFLKAYEVEIVYPIAHKKYISWLDYNTLEEKDYRKSPKTGSVYDAFKELYKIKKYLNHNNLKITILLIDIKEQRYLNGYSKDKKRGSSRCNQIPLELIDEITLNNYDILVIDKENEFTSKDYAKAIKRNRHCAQIILNILCYLDIIQIVRKERRTNVYKFIKK